MEDAMTMKALLSRKDELENSLSLAYDILRDQPGATNLSALMRRCIKPRDNDTQDQSWSTLSKERISNLEQAYRSYDLELALKNGQLVRPEAPSPGEERFLTLVDESRELAGLRKVLGWHHAFRVSVEVGDAVQVLKGLVQIGVNNLGSCDCDVDETYIVNSPALIWLHAHHTEHNRAVWETIAAKPGMIHALRAALEADIAGPTKRLGTRLFGEISSRRYARALRANFLTNRPSPSWVGATPRPS